MRKQRLTGLTKAIVVFIAILIFVIVLFSLFVYFVQSINVIDIHIDSTEALLVFIGLILASTTVIAIFGTFLETLRIHMFKEHYRYLTVPVQELIGVTLLGLCLHGADQIMDGVEIHNVRSEVLLTLLIYGFFFLIEKFAERLKERDAAANREHPD